MAFTGTYYQIIDQRIKRVCPRILKATSLHGLMPLLLADRDKDIAMVSALITTDKGIIKPEMRFKRSSFALVTWKCRQAGICCACWSDFVLTSRERWVKPHWLLKSCTSIPLPHQPSPRLALG